MGGPHGYEYRARSENYQGETPHHRKRGQSNLKGFLRDNGLSLVLLALFLTFLTGQLVSGWLTYNEEQGEHEQAPIGFIQYLGTGACGEAVFENWESEFLQMCLYVVLTVFLFQRGSAESKDPDKQEDGDEESGSTLKSSYAPKGVQRGRIFRTIYNHQWQPCCEKY
jgi:hypothetical protein